MEALIRRASSPGGVSDLLRDGAAFFRTGRRQDAANAFSAVLHAEPNNQYALNALGAICTTLGDYARAIDFMKRAISVAPKYTEAYANLATPYLALGRNEDAKKAAQVALQRNPQHAVALIKLGAAETRLGNLEAAATALQAALELAPASFEAHMRYGEVLGKQQDYDRAKSAFSEAIELRPDSASAYHNLGSVSWLRGDGDGAVEHFHKAIELEPRNLEARHSLIMAYTGGVRNEDLRAAVDDARNIAPENKDFLVAHAGVLCREGEDDAALGVLEDIGDDANLKPGYRRQRMYLLAEIHERKGDYETAFNLVERANGLYAESPETKAAAPDLYAAKLTTLRGRFTPAWTREWRTISSPDDRVAPVFLVGFPRSGTTLLENFLRGHGAFAVLEEKSMAFKANVILESLPGGEPEALADMSAEDVASLRQAYFDELTRQLAREFDQRQPPERVIDKNPMNMVRAGMLHRMFPDAKLIFVERDPRDCVVSAFTQPFSMNPVTANFLDLKKTATIYDAAMTVWTEIKESLPLEVHTLRYEKLVEESEPHLRDLLAFLGEEWKPALLDHVATVRRRKRVTSASYRQVTQKLYTTSRGRWRRFEKQLEPVRPILDKWAERLGYDV